MLLCYLLIAACASTNQFTPVIYPATILSQCGQDNPNHLATTLQHIKQQLPSSQCSLANKRSCKEVLQYCPSVSSGYYHITALNGSQVQVYCDMNGTNCGGEGGWMRVAYVNMSESGTTCPGGLAQQTYSGLTLCSRSTSSGDGCQGVVFSTLDLNYSKVCGQLRGYQVLTPNAFLNQIEGIDGAYVDGASTHMGVPPESTFGHTQVDIRHVLVIPIVPTLLLCMLEMTTTVSQAVVSSQTPSVIPCGMDSSVMV